jgi:hypothetical protein
MLGTVKTSIPGARMRNRVAGRALPAGFILLLIVFIAASFLLRKDTYLLNKNVRLVCLRIWKYEELSLHRASTYRIQFTRHDYRVSALAPGPNEAWREVSAFPYEGSIKAAAPGLTILLNDGALVSYQTDEEREKLRSSMILYFFHKDDPSRRRGIIFLRPGEWRAL